MEKIFYENIDSYKTKKMNTGTVRERVSTINSEKNFVNLLFKNIK